VLSQSCELRIRSLPLQDRRVVLRDRSATLALERLGYHRGPAATCAGPDPLVEKVNELIR
jgi:hypothetical protein